MKLRDHVISDPEVFVSSAAAEAEALFPDFRLIS